MWYIGDASVVILLVIIVCKTLHEKITVHVRNRQISNQIVERDRTFEKFKASFGASDELVYDALLQERSNSASAQSIRRRLLNEADVDAKRFPDSLISTCHFIALGILAQDGKIPIDFITDGIDWARECVIIKQEYPCQHRDDVYEMVERFVRWYDNELVRNGVKERLVQLNDGVRIPNVINDVAYRNETTEIVSLDRLRKGRPLFWHPADPRSSIHSSFRRISRRLIK